MDAIEKLTVFIVLFLYSLILLGSSYSVGKRYVITEYCQSIGFEDMEVIDDLYYCQNDHNFELVEWLVKND